MSEWTGEKGGGKKEKEEACPPAFHSLDDLGDLPHATSRRNVDFYAYNVKKTREYTDDDKWPEDTPPPAAWPPEVIDVTLGYDKPMTYARLPFAWSDTPGPSHKCLSSRKKVELIREAMNSLAGGVYGWDHLYSGIITYESHFKGNQLRKVLDSLGGDGYTLISKIAKIAQRAGSLFTQPLPLLRMSLDVRTVSMTQEQAACLLAYSFFCCFSASPKGFNSFSFLSIHNGYARLGEQKINFMLSYFDQVTTSMPNGTLSYVRQGAPSNSKTTAMCEAREKWRNMEEPLCDLEIFPEHRIEDAEGCLHVDFANQFIGGGVLGNGAVQEEIMMLCRPELLVSLLLCERLYESEAILIYGAQTFSNYEGYSGSLKWRPLAKPHPRERDKFGRAKSYVAAMDALFIRPDGLSWQYKEENVVREIVKAYAAFHAPNAMTIRRPVSTGNWGCGAFNGNVELKSLIQLVACSRAERKLLYFPFDKNTNFTEGFLQLHRTLRRKKITTGLLFYWLCHYAENRRKTASVFDFISGCCEDPEWLSG